jgi:hypothetical protein
MAKKKASKAGRKIVTLECTEARGEGGTPSRYSEYALESNVFVTVAKVVVALRVLYKSVHVDIQTDSFLLLLVLHPM